MRALLMRVALLVAVMFGVGVPLLTAGTAQAATRTPAATHAREAPAAPGGLCQVPGIGDIGGLVGLCQAGSSGLLGDLNNICQPSVPSPEQATGGINAMVQPRNGAKGTALSVGGYEVVAAAPNWLGIPFL